MTMIDRDICKLCEENGHEVEREVCETGVGVFCPCCDRLDVNEFHDIKEESDFEFPEGGEGPSDFS